MWKKISNLSALFTILGVSAGTLLNDQYKVHVALAVFVATCLSVGAYAIWRINIWQRMQFPKGYMPVATFVRYTTTDGKNVIYETFRQIQIKHAFLTKIDHRYFWTGSKPPKISSLLQKIGPTTKDKETEYDVVEVKFPSPRFFNETEIVHLRSTMDDSDEKSDTHASLLVEQPSRLIQFRIELLHCTHPIHSGMVAKVERRLKKANSSQFESITDVNFDVPSRSFEYAIVGPEPGFVYRIRWDRPKTKGNQGTSKNHR